AEDRDAPLPPNERVDRMLGAIVHRQNEPLVKPIDLDFRGDPRRREPRMNPPSQGLGFSFSRYVAGVERVRHPPVVGTDEALLTPGAQKQDNEENDVRDERALHRSSNCRTTARRRADTRSEISLSKILT